MFKQTTSRVDFNDLELEILDFWNKNKIFQKSITNRNNSPVYYFYDGPPFATGTPHYGHILAGTIKDVIPRFRTMLGYKVPRKFGWDCHGLPVEFEAEKELNLKGKLDIEKYGVAKFNEYCRNIVLRYSNQWRSMVQRMGRWVDLDNDYKTMDKDFMESIWWVFNSLYEKKLIYLSKKIVPYSSRLSTPLSNFEVNLGYRIVIDPSIVVKFKLRDENNSYFLAWTTTPWTLPANLSLTIDPKIKYCKLKCENEFYYLAQFAIEKIFNNKEYEIIKVIKGIELKNKYYQPLFPYYKKYNQAFYVSLGDYIDQEIGTGIVHTAPSFGENDFITGKKYDLPLIMPFDENGIFKEEINDYKGMFFKDADKKIIRDLKKQNMLFSTSQIEHSYPFCWRSETPLMYRTINSWFVDVNRIKSNLIKNNDAINWYPHHVKDGRMGKWLENARDWAISRNRYWGSTIPVWICDKCKHKLSFSSISSLELKSEQKIDDIHSHFVDKITFKCDKCDGIMKRTPEVLDCWFESGSMPYGEIHYPFENKETFEKSFPADFISEGLDQTRGWFYTLLVLSTALLDKPAFKNCIVSGLVLADDGQKMSKRLKNYPDPKLMIKEFGADTIRLYMLNSGAIKAEELKFTKQGLIETIRGHLIPLWNVLNFFTTYANLDKWKPKENETIDSINLENPLDRWIISRLYSILEVVTNNLNKYNLNGIIEPLLKFNDQLTNWYLRRSRRRFWKSEFSTDKNQAYITTYFVLITISKMLAPIVPFISEAIYQILKVKSQSQSVHLCDYPKVENKFFDKKLEKTMDIAIITAQLGRSLRYTNNIKLRQPLSKLTLLSKDKKILKLVEDVKEIICDEVNVKQIVVSSSEDELVKFSARPNFSVLGKKYGRKIPKLKKVIEEISSDDLSEVLSNDKEILLNIDGEDIILNNKNILIDRKQKEGDQTISSQGKITIALDIKITKDLKLEGIAREVQNRIQNTRKLNKLAVEDKIIIKYDTSKEIKEAILNFENYLKSECLCINFINIKDDNTINYSKHIIDNQNFNFSISKV